MNAANRLTRFVFAWGMFPVMMLTAGSVAAAEIDCQIPNNVKCTVTDPNGIQSVKVILATGLGQVAVVDETFPSCPQSVEVSWDPIVPGAQFEVEPCKSGKFTFATQVGEGDDEKRDVLILSRENGGRAARRLATPSIGVTCDDAPANGVRLVFGTPPGDQDDVCDDCNSCVFGCCWDGFPVVCNKLAAK